MKPHRPEAIPGANAVRAIACLWVFFYHWRVWCPEGGAQVPWLGQGSLGVAMFFVLSGFLLSMPFLQSLRDGKPMPSLRVYALRRLGRIAPEFYVCVLVTATLAGTWATAWGRRQIGTCLTFTSSFLPPTFSPRYNGPLWSIGVEAVFYVLLPLSAWLLLRRRTGFQGRVATVIGLIAAITAWQHLLLWAAPSIESAVGNVSVFHAGSSSTVKNSLALFVHFLVGTLAADVYLALSRAPRPDAQPSPGFNRYDAVALAAIAWAAAALFTGYDRSPLTQWLPHLPAMHYGWPTFPVLVGVVLCTVPRSGVLSRFSEPAWIRLTARWSFGIYIWHSVVCAQIYALWPKPEGDGVVLRNVGCCVLGLIASYALAGLSYRFIGKPGVALAKRLEERFAGPRSCEALAKLGPAERSARRAA